VRVAKAGFATVERSGLILQVGGVSTINIELPVAARSQKIDVVEAAPIVDTGRSTIGAVVDRGEIENLPINGRSFLDFSRTVAGVTARQTGVRAAVSALRVSADAATTSQSTVSTATERQHATDNESGRREFQVATS